MRMIPFRNLLWVHWVFYSIHCTNQIRFFAMYKACHIQSGVFRTHNPLKHFEENTLKHALRKGMVSPEQWQVLITSRLHTLIFLLDTIGPYHGGRPLCCLKRGGQVLVVLPLVWLEPVQNSRLHSTDELRCLQRRGWGLAKGCWKGYYDLCYGHPSLLCMPLELQWLNAGWCMRTYNSYLAHIN